MRGLAARPVALYGVALGAALAGVLALPTEAHARPGAPAARELELPAATGPGTRTDMGPGVRTGLEPGTWTAAEPRVRSAVGPKARTGVEPGVRAAAVGRISARAPGTLPAVDELSKFYVVKAPEDNGGRTEALVDIAARTLGDGDRFGVLPDGPGATGPDAGRTDVAPHVQVAVEGRSAGPSTSGGDPVPFPVLVGGTAGVAALALAVLVRRNPAPVPVSVPRGAGAQGAVLVGSGAAWAVGSAGAVGTGRGRASGTGGAWGPGAGTGQAVRASGTGMSRVARGPGKGAARATRGPAANVAGMARVSRARLPRSMALAVVRRRRGALARQLAADIRTPVVVRHALAELMTAGTPDAPVRVHTVLAEGDRLRACVSGPPTGTAPPPWTVVDTTHWQREGLPPALGPAPPDPVLPLPHLARLGVDGRGAQVMVGLGQLDGSLSVRGDLRVARDTVAALAIGLLEPPWQNTVVVIVGPPAGVLPGQHGLVRIPSVGDVRDRAPAEVFATAEDLGIGPVLGSARSGGVTGFLLMLQPPGHEEARVLTELAAPHGGWTVLTVGDVPGAHWRWYAEPGGTVDLGVLGLRVTVPAHCPTDARTATPVRNSRPRNSRTLPTGI
ncbi:hypothetical protein GT204_01820 [Streptomyces sp. SID4919]|uniref:hypothetical protein n=1 Tax=unclassified Streptomyces TaxID=2593676 RepID=UPI000C079BEB|nr:MULTISPECIES: hypothetical protein [unclassified Streptomyces]MYY07664.1 hypothetical protein [Streptomyces sp. SID4919]